MKVPFVLKWNQAEAEAAWIEHKALLQAQVAAPTLAKNPQFIMLKQDAYERFHSAFKRG